MREKYFKYKAKDLKNLSMQLGEGGSNFMDIIIQKHFLMQSFAQSHPPFLFWFSILSIISKE